MSVWTLSIQQYNIRLALVLALPAMVYPTEVLTPRYRSICGLLVVSTALGAGVLLVVAVAVFIREWRTLQLIMTFVPVPMLAAPWILPESYRWLYAKVRLNGSCVTKKDDQFTYVCFE